MQTAFSLYEQRARTNNDTGNVFIPAPFDPTRQTGYLLVIFTLSNSKNLSSQYPRLIVAQNTNEQSAILAPAWSDERHGEMVAHQQIDIEFDSLARESESPKLSS